MRYVVILCIASLILLACAKARPQQLALGLDKNDIDTTVRPQDDFFRYVNGGWLDRTQIPDDRPRYGSFDELAVKAEEDLKVIIEELVASRAAEGSEPRKIADLYLSFMSEDMIAQAGITPIRAELDRIAAITGLQELIGFFARSLREGGSAPLVLYVGQDQGKSDRYITHLSQSGLGLPDRDYYLKDDETSIALRSAYRDLIRKLFEQAGQEDAEIAAGQVVDLETRIASAHWTRVQNRDRRATYNLTSLDQLQARHRLFDWPLYLQAAGVAEVQEMVIRQPDYLAALETLLAEVPIKTWKRYLTWHLLRDAAPYLGPEFVDAHFAFYGRSLQGLKEQRPRWKRGLDLVNRSLGDALGQIYVARHFPGEAKTRMERLVANLRAAFALAIDDLDWMSAETKVEARKKLAAFNSKIGYPSKWKEYESLVVADADLLGNLRRSFALEYQRNLDKLNQPIDREEWFMTPQTVNAYYNSTLNEIVFPAAILQPPFFNIHADEAVNYGAIGAVIGHEITHGFDDQGRRSDGEGNLRDWWTQEDEGRFRARAQLIIDQYAAYEPLPGMFINGELSLGENIADLGGLTVAFRAYRLSLGDRPAPVIEGFSGPQRFFMGWAQIWRIKFRDEALRNQLITGPHSPGPFRVKGPLGNMPEFYEAFAVSENDGMFRPVELRAKIW